MFPVVGEIRSCDSNYSYIYWSAAAPAALAARGWSIHSQFEVREWFPAEWSRGGCPGGWGGAGLGEWRDAGIPVAPNMVMRLAYRGSPECSAIWEAAIVSPGVYAGIVRGAERRARLATAFQQSPNRRLGVEVPGASWVRDPLSGELVWLGDGREASRANLREARARWADGVREAAKKDRRKARQVAPLSWRPFAQALA